MRGAGGKEESNRRPVQPAPEKLSPSALAIITSRAPVSPGRPFVGPRRSRRRREHHHLGDG
jgi:hypothetical protein